MKTQTTYEQKQLTRMVNELLIKDAWSGTFIRKNLNKDENNLFKKTPERMLGN